jgi:hypothetical protein
LRSEGKSSGQQIKRARIGSQERQRDVESSVAICEKSLASDYSRSSFSYGAIFRTSKYLNDVNYCADVLCNGVHIRLNDALLSLVLILTVLIMALFVWIFVSSVVI